MYGQAIITIRITPDFSGDKAASGLEVVVPMPREVARVHCELGRDAKSGAAGQTWDWQERARRLVWKFKRVQGGLEHTLRVRSPLSVPFWSFLCMYEYQSAMSPGCMSEARPSLALLWRLLISACLQQSSSPMPPCADFGCSIARVCTANSAA